MCLHQRAYEYHFRVNNSVPTGPIRTLDQRIDQTCTSHIRTYVIIVVNMLIQDLIT